MISIIASYTDPKVVMMAGALTFGVVIGLTLYAFYTKTDFTMLGGILFILVMVLIVAGILAAVFRSRWGAWGICIGGSIIFGLYLIMDTQLIIGKNKNYFSIDDYIMAAINIYIDILQLFLFILQILNLAGVGNN
jgi:FtsH-binding integral membrane protein